MKTLLKIEELFMFLLSIYFFNLCKFTWWLFPALLLIPDLSFIGYAFGKKVGATSYNFFHHKAVAIVIGLVGVSFNLSHLVLAGIILFAHSSMDRILGYGLKYFTSFHDTHLGKIGKVSNENALVAENV